MRTLAALLGVAATVASAPGVLAQSEDPNAPTIHVNANGNAFTGGLGFVPDKVSARIGQVVEWTNTDFLVPHTATEDHGLWDLGGTYGMTPANPSGFGPGTSVSRAFEAGTERYYCRVHPTQMKGVIAVPVELNMIGRPAARKRRRPIREVVATWAVAAPAQGEVFDVEIKRGAADWQPFRAGTRETGGLFRAGKRGTTWTVRARLRKDGSDTAATDWSPDATIVSDQKR